MAARYKNSQPLTDLQAALQRLTWALDDQQLALMIKTAAATVPQPEMHIRGDKDVRYERVALAMAAAQQAGVQKIGFITEPKAQ